MMGTEGETDMAVRTRDPIHTVNISLMVCTVACLVCYDILGGLWLKGLTSAWFVALGITNLAYGRHRGVRHRFLWMTALGLASATIVATNSEQKKRCGEVYVLPK